MDMEGPRDKGLIEGTNKKIALLIAVLALFLAFSETLGKSAQTAGIGYNVEASNSVGVLPSQDHPADPGGNGRSGDDGRGRAGESNEASQGGEGQANRLLAENRATLPFRAGHA